ncbi:WXG100 family type VII secretion target [Streptacidiphilus sp. PB12-B1b]|uniref:WXG100 family type VII secretion target n=1 Tax=Streptacidiphilus sp. PB12-B1b TaxID=2705012 RepID=UPI0015FB6A46|nr:WXG100 family type VII secretion target [Streptacidiphilus sp. PB12-B1b]QMU79433.1 WXG100 family type VII secretion target [Streptacidiphilus sp. PB12-B1b]
MREPGGSDSWSPVTDFEKSSHEELHGMIAAADPKSVLAVGDTLAAASTQIQSLADDLSQHINGLQWTGSAADSFTGWARQVISSTDTLAGYANNTSVAITMAGQQLGTAQAGMPPVPHADMATVSAFKQQQRFSVDSGLNFDGSVKDPAVSGLVVVPPGGITQKQAFAAQANVESAYQEALSQMESLGGSYVGAVSTMGVSTVPTFPPLPGALMPPKGGGYYGSLENQPGVGGSGSRSTTAYRPAAVPNPGSVSKDDSSAGSHSGPGGTTLVPVPPPVTGGSGGSTTLQGANPPTPPPPPGTPGTPGSGGAGSGPTGGGTTVLPPPVAPIPPGGGGEFGGTPPADGGIDVTGSGISGGAVGSAPGRNRFGAAAVGEETGAGGGFAEGTGSGVASGSYGESAATASITARSGISGAPVADESAASAADSRGTNELMSGGMGMGGMGRMGGSKRKGRRAAYLVEDEETWTSGTPGTNPAVIE